jgi:hypothetical protein
MSEENQQPVADKTDDQAKPDAEGNGAQDTTTQVDDLDAALNEFNEATGSSTEQKTTEKPDPEKDRLERLERSLAEREYREDMTKVVTSIRGDFAPDEVDDEFIDTWVNAEAKKDPRVANAWVKRHADPKGFERVLNGLSRKFAEKHAKLRKQDDAATADKEAVANYVRGSSKSAPEKPVPNLGKMTDAELQAYKDSLGM